MSLNWIFTPQVIARCLHLISHLRANKILPPTGDYQISGLFNCHPAVNCQPCFVFLAGKAWIRPNAGWTAPGIYHNTVY